jgi:hypothetical protein
VPRDCLSRPLCQSHTTSILEFPPALYS